MEINANYVPNSNAPLTQPNREISDKAVSPSNNDIIKGEASLLPNGDIQVKTSDGSTVSGTPIKPVEPGGEQSFLVKVIDGKIFLEPVKTESPQTEAIRNALEASGLKADSENVNLAKILLSYNLPLNKENLQNFKMALKLTGDPEKAIFMLENNIRPTLKNTELLTRILSGENMVAEAVNELSKSLENLPDTLVKNILKDIFTSAPQSVTEKSDTLTLLSDKQVNLEGQPNTDTSAIKTPDSINNFQSRGDVLIEEAVKNIIKNIPAQPDSPVVKLLQEAFPEHNQLITRQIEENVQIKAFLAGLTGPEGSVREQIANISPELKLPLQNLISGNTAVSTDLQEKFLNGNLSTEEFKILLEQLNLKNEAKSTLEQEQSTFSAKLSYNPKDEINVGKYLTDLSMRLELAKRIIERLPEGEAGDILKNINNLRQNIQFTTQVKQCEFFQVPVNIYNQERNGEFYIVKNNKKTQKAGGTVSALIALDTANMGRFETYLVKDGQEVECRFRLENDKVTELVKSNISQLEDLLKQYNYLLKLCSFQNLTKPFNLLDTGKKEKSAELGRFAVDIRA